MALVSTRRSKAVLSETAFLSTAFFTLLYTVSSNTQQLTEVQAKLQELEEQKKVTAELRRQAVVAPETDAGTEKTTEAVAQGGKRSEAEGDGYTHCTPQPHDSQRQFDWSYIRQLLKRQQADVTMVVQRQVATMASALEKKMKASLDEQLREWSENICTKLGSTRGSSLQELDVRTGKPDAGKATGQGTTVEPAERRPDCYVGDVQETHQDSRRQYDWADIQTQLENHRSEVSVMVNRQVLAAAATLEKKLKLALNEQARNLAERAKETEESTRRQIKKVSELLASEQGQKSAQSDFEQQSALVALKNDMSLFMRESEREWREQHATLEKEIQDTRNEVRALTQAKDKGVAPRRDHAMTNEAREQLENLTKRVEEIETRIMRQVKQAFETIARQQSRLSAQSGFEQQSALVALKNDMSLFMRESEREWREQLATLEKEIQDTRNEVRALTQAKGKGVAPRRDHAMTNEAREQLENLTKRVEEIETGIVRQVKQAFETIARQQSRLSAQSGFEQQSALVALKNDLSLFMRESEREWREQHAILEKKLEDALREKEARRRGADADVFSLHLHGKMDVEGTEHRQVSFEMKKIDGDACRRAVPPHQDYRTTGLHCHHEDYTRQPICPSTSFDRLPGDKPSRHSSYGSCAGGLSPTFPPLSPPPLSVVY